MRDFPFFLRDPSDSFFEKKSGLHLHHVNPAFAGVYPLSAAQRAISQSLLTHLPPEASCEAAAKAVDAWAQDHADTLARTRDFLSQLEASGDLSIAKLTLANSQIHKLSDI